jgi:hypothetical protein
VLPAVCVQTLGVRNTRHVEAVPALQETRFSLRPTGYAVDASPLLFAVRSLTTPPWTPDALRVGGEPLPDRDFHPARDAKLSWRDNARPELLLEAGARQLDRDKARCVLHVSSSPPFRTGLAAFTAPGSAPVLLLHGVP